MPPKLSAHWKQRASELNTQVYALYYAWQDPRVPWFSKALITFIVAYVLNPIDLIPDFIPGLGTLDEIVLVPIGVAIAIKMIPKPTWEECRKKGRMLTDKRKPKFWVGGVIIIWFILLTGIVFLVLKLLKK